MFQFLREKEQEALGSQEAADSLIASLTTISPPFFPGQGDAAPAIGNRESAGPHREGMGMTLCALCGGGEETELRAIPDLGRGRKGACGGDGDLQARPKGHILGREAPERLAGARAGTRRAAAW